MTNKDRDSGHYTMIVAVDPLRGRHQLYEQSSIGALYPR